jgi:hypothetical protein
LTWVERIVSLLLPKAINTSLPPHDSPSNFGVTVAERGLHRESALANAGRWPPFRDIYSNQSVTGRRLPNRSNSLTASVSCFVKSLIMDANAH